MLGWALLRWTGKYEITFGIDYRPHFTIVRSVTKYIAPDAETQVLLSKYVKSHLG